MFDSKDMNIEDYKVGNEMEDSNAESTNERDKQFNVREVRSIVCQNDLLMFWLQQAEKKKERLCNKNRKMQSSLEDKRNVKD